MALYVDPDTGTTKSTGTTVKSGTQSSTGSIGVRLPSSSGGSTTTTSSGTASVVGSSGSTGSTGVRLPSSSGSTSSSSSSGTASVVGGSGSTGSIGVRLPTSSGSSSGNSSGASTGGTAVSAPIAYTPAETRQTADATSDTASQQAASSTADTGAWNQQLAALWAQLQQQQNTQAADYSSYIRELQEAANQKALAQLKTAYDKNVNEIAAAREKIAPQYQQARTQAASQAALERQTWNEQAAALGLNSGVNGQAALAQSVALQGNLNSLNQAESADLAELERQRAQTLTDYNNAIAQAQADGEYQLAQALYEEKVRVDEANREIIANVFQQQLALLQLERSGLESDRDYAEQVRQYNQNLALQQSQLAESIRQYNQNYAADRADTAWNQAYQSQAFDRGVLESDRDYAADRADTAWNQAYQNQAFNRDVLESDRDYAANRADTAWNQAYQSQVFDRNVLESDRDYAADRADTAWQQEYQNKTFEESVREFDLTTELSRQGQTFQQMFSMATTLAEYGDFTGFSALGVSQDTVDKMAFVWNENNDLAKKAALADIENTQANTGYVQSNTANTNADTVLKQLNAKVLQMQLAGYSASSSSSRSSSGSSSSSSSSSSSNGSDSAMASNMERLFRAAQASGYPEVYIANNYKSYGLKLAGLQSAYKQWEESGASSSTTASSSATLSDTAKSILKSYQNVNPGTSANIPGIFADRIETALKNGKISEADADYLLNVIGY